MERAASLVHRGNPFSYIVPNTFCDLENCDEFRRWFLGQLSVDSFWQSGWAFHHAIVDTLVFVALRRAPESDQRIRILIHSTEYFRTVRSFLQNNLLKIDYRNPPEQTRIFRRLLTDNPPLSAFATVKAGVKMYERGQGA